MHIHKIVYIKTFKIAPTCFDPKIIFREVQCSSLKMILGSRHVGAILIFFNEKQFCVCELFFLYFSDRASQYIYLNINQLDALNFIMSLFHASTYFDHMCSKYVEA